MFSYMAARKKFVGPKMWQQVKEFVASLLVPSDWCKITKHKQILFLLLKPSCVFLCAGSPTFCSKKLEVARRKLVASISA